MTNALMAPRLAGGRAFDLPNLDEDRERALLRRVRSPESANDSSAALSELWMSHGKLVLSIAARYRRSDMDHDDLINAGHLGLHAAITRFDMTRTDTRLSGYAATWIRWYIHDYIRRNAGPVRLPESRAHRQLAQSAPRLIAQARAACLRDGVTPSDHEIHIRIGARIGLCPDDVAQALRLVRGVSASLSNWDDDAGTEKQIKDDAALSADDMIERMDHKRLRARLRFLADQSLGQREREIFLARSLTNSEDVPSLEAFAARYGVSIARIHQIEISARRKIAAALAASGYTDANGDSIVARLSQVRARRAPGLGRRGAEEKLSVRRVSGRHDDLEALLDVAD